MAKVILEDATPYEVWQIIKAYPALGLQMTKQLEKEDLLQLIKEIVAERISKINNPSK